MRRVSVAVLLGLVAAASMLVSRPILGQRGSRFERETINGRDVVAREVLVKFRQTPLAADMAGVRADGDADDVHAVGRAGAFLVRSRSRSAAALVAALSRRPNVAFVEPNFVVRMISEPNDPRFPELWGLKNLGQVIAGVPGLPGADIHAADAWNISLGSTAHVVAVIDTGIDYTHPDLAGNMWSAPTAFTVTVGGGPVTCAAGTHGFNVITRSCNPMDDEDHGTHVAGTIGATGDNGTGVVGVNWITRLMAIKFIDATGYGTTADAIAAVEFAIAVKQRFAAIGGADIRVLSNSWGGDEFSQMLLDEVNAANDAEMLFVAGAGNSSFDNDLLPFYPASFDAPNVVAVAATDNADELAWFSNYGPSSVHLAAPGVDILSTTIGNHYAYLSGTSMATPHVSGAAALVLSQCGLSTPELKEALLGTVDPLPTLTSITTTGGRVNVHSALYSCTAIPETPASLTARGDDARVALTWAAALGATRYNVKRSLTPGGPYSSINASVHGTTYTDTGLVNGTTYYYVVSAINTQGESGDSNEASATANIPPDMVVSSFTTPSVGASASTITVPVTTKNQGAGLAEASTTRFYWSDDSILDASDAPLNAQAVPQLSPGAQSSISITLAIPSATTGVHYLIATADADNVLSESNEANNTSIRSIKIGPDLILSALTVPGNGGADSSIVVNDTAKNQGGGAAPPTETRFYLSSNVVLDAGDTLIGSRDVGALDAGASNSGSTTLVIPSSTVAGTYYVIGATDAAGSVAETSENNNTFSRNILIGGDLSVSSLAAPAKGGAGVTITVTDTTSNTGGGGAVASVTRFYLSNNSTLDGGDTLLAASHAVPALAPGGTNSASTALTMPNLPAGTYYLIAKADDDNVVLEPRETNNTLARAISIGGDLSVAAFTTPAVGGAGTAFTITDSTTNLGGGAIGPSTTRFYLSVNSLLDGADTAIGSRNVGALDPGATSSGSTTATIPPSTASGTYYLIVKVDADGLLVETSEANNTTARSILVGSDLAVSSLTAPAKAGAGASITVTDTTSNTGGGGAGASVTRFYLSVNGTLDGTDWLLAGGHAVPGLAPGAADSASTLLTLPGVSTGVYYIIARADDDNVVSESRETNNTIARTISIGSDLTMASFTTPSSGGAGLPITVTDSTSNQGGGSVGATTTKIYLSSNTVFEPGDMLLGARSVPALTAGAASTGPTTITIPATLSVGAYYLIARADADDEAAETSEANNTLVRSIQIGSDLLVSTVTAPARGAAGSSIAVNDTTTNQGGGNAPASTTAFYLSITGIPGPSDILLDGSRAVPPVAAGAANSGVTTVTIPAGTASGVFYIMAKADDGNAVAETVETNNTRARQITIGPDLIVSTFSIAVSSVQAGGTINVLDTVVNQGAEAAGSTTTRFYLSTNAALDAGDVLLTPGRPVPLLAGGASSAGSTPVTIPADTAPRSYYLFAQTDGDGAVAESSETNNGSTARLIQVTAP